MDDFYRYLLNILSSVEAFYLLEMDLVLKKMFLSTKIFYVVETHFRLEQHFIEDNWVVARCRAACLCTRVVCGEAFHRDDGEVIS